MFQMTMSALMELITAIQMPSVLILPAVSPVHVTLDTKVMATPLAQDVQVSF